MVVEDGRGYFGSHLSFCVDFALRMRGGALGGWFSRTKIMQRAWARCIIFALPFGHARREYLF